MSGSSDFYARLELANTATGEEIKKAYRRLSLVHHPDRNANNPESVKAFQSIGEAYEMLSDPAKRRQYDFSLKNGGVSQGGGMGNMPSFQSPEEMFAHIFGGMGGGGGMPFPIPGMMGHGAGPDMMSGMGSGSGLFPGTGGGGGGVRFQVFRNGVPVDIETGMNKPTPITKKLEIDMAMVLNGGSVPIEVDRWVLEGGVKRMETVNMYIDIIQGIDTNEIMILEGKGNIMNDRCKGDIKVIIQVTNDSDFIRKGLDLILHRSISIKDALCGFTFELKYLNGKTYTISNPAGNIIVPEYNKQLDGMGLKRGNAVGNLIIVFHIQFPTSLDMETIDKLKEIL